MMVLLLRPRHWNHWCMISIDQNTCMEFTKFNSRTLQCPTSNCNYCDEFYLMRYNLLLYLRRNMLTYPKYESVLTNFCINYVLSTCPIYWICNYAIIRMIPSAVLECVPCCERASSRAYAGLRPSVDLRACVRTLFPRHSVARWRFDRRETSR
jgi:hypothetical protein